MLIPVNQNIDEYKDDFYKGLTLRQSVISLVTVAAGVVVYLGLTVFFHLPQTLALHLTLPVVFPIAAYGFLKIHGMNIAEYIRKSGAVKEHSSYTEYAGLEIQRTLPNICFLSEQRAIRKLRLSGGTGRKIPGMRIFLSVSFCKGSGRRERTVHLMVLQSDRDETAGQRGIVGTWNTFAVLWRELHIRTQRTGIL